MGPGLALAWAKGYLTEFGMMLAMTSVSTVYHFCQSGIYCLLPFTSLQTSDHFFVYSTLVWLILFFTDARMEWRFLAFVLMQGMLLPMIIVYIHQSWLVSVAIGVPSMVGLVYIMLVGKMPKCDWRDMIFSVVLIGVGLFFHIFAGDPGTTNYDWAHTLWHIACMLSIYFLLDSKDSIFWLRKFIWKKTYPRKSVVAESVHILFV